jgi:hypothetical protein
VQSNYATEEAGGRRYKIHCLRVGLVYSGATAATLRYATEEADDREDRKIIMILMTDLN